MRDEGALLSDGYRLWRVYEGRLGSVVAIDIRGPPRPRAAWMQETTQLWLGSSDQNSVLRRKAR